MNHLLDSCTFAATVWDKGVMEFRRSDRRHGQPSRSLCDWHPKSFRNPIIRTIWEAFPGMTMWCLWKERNARIFRDQRKDAEAVWKMVKDNLLSSIRCMHWHNQDNIIPREEAQIAVNWGLDRSMMDGLRQRDKLCQPSSPKFWSTPPHLVFKLNFDGASRGHPGPVGFGGLCHDHAGRIMMVFLGSIGKDTNNSAELEGLIRGLEVLIRGGFFQQSSKSTPTLSSRWIGG